MLSDSRLPSGPGDQAKALRVRAKGAMASGDHAALEEIVSQLCTLARDPELADTISHVYSLLNSSNLTGYASKLAAAAIANDTAAAAVYLGEIQKGDRRLKEPLGVSGFVETMRSNLDLLRRAARTLTTEERVRRRIVFRTAYTLYFLGADDEIESLCRSLISAGPPGTDSQQELAAVAEVLRGSCAPDSLEILSELVRRYPDDMRIAASYANLQMKFRGPAAEIRQILERAIREDPDHISAWRWLAIHLLDQQDWDKAEPVIGHVARKGRSADERLRMATVLIRRGKLGRATRYLQSIPPRAGGEAFGSLADPLRGVLDAAAVNYRFADHVDVSLLRESLDRSLATLNHALQQMPSPPLQDLLDCGAELVRLSHAPFSHFADKTEQFDFEWTEPHGTLDTYANRAIFFSLLEHAAALAGFALSPAAMQGHVEPRSVARELAAFHTGLLALLGRTRQAGQKLDWLMSLGFDTYYFRQLRETCDLEDGSAFTPAGWKNPDWVSDTRTSLHQSAEFDRWCQLEGLNPVVLTDDAETPSTFALVRDDGIVQHGSYTLPRLTLHGVPGASVTIRDSELVFGPAGTLMGPHIWHCRRKYPTPSPIVISQGRRGARLKAAQSYTRIDEPVIVLGNNDSSRLANYFHWTILILARINFLAQHGYLSDRKLLLPAEITGWMRETLKLIGVSDDMVRFYGRSEDIAVADALVISPIQTPSREMLRGLRARMWKSVGIASEQPVDPQGSLLFLMRRNQARRMVLPADDVCDAAEKAGYSLIAPEDVSVAEQVRMFAAARAVSGPVGAAFTNLLFCRSGTRILPLMKEESYYPSFNDLAIGLDLEFRWCLGKTEPHWLSNGTDLIHSPYVMNLDVLSRQLAWASSEVRD